MIKTETVVRCNAEEVADVPFSGKIELVADADRPIYEIRVHPFVAAVLETLLGGKSITFNANASERDYAKEN